MRLVRLIDQAIQVGARFARSNRGGHCINPKSESYGYSYVTSSATTQMAFSLSGRRPTILPDGFHQPNRPADRAAAHGHQRQQASHYRDCRVVMLVADGKVEQEERHSTADHV